MELTDAKNPYRNTLTPKLPKQILQNLEIRHHRTKAYSALTNPRPFPTESNSLSAEPDRTSNTPESQIEQTLSYTSY